MSALRRQLLDDADAPAELSPDLAFLAARQAALASLFVDHAELYRHLRLRYDEEGSSEDLRATALDAAGNLGALLQSLRRREDLLAVLHHAPGHAPVPMPVIDQLVANLLLLSGPPLDNLAELLAPADDFQGANLGEATTTWLHGLGAG